MHMVTPEWQGYVSHMTTENSHSLFTTHIVHHSHSCVPHKGQISSLKEFQVCCRHKIQCSSSYSYSIVIYKLHSSMHLNTGGQWLTRFEIQRKNKNSTTVQIKIYDRHTDTSFIVYIYITYRKRASSVCLECVESTEAERNICRTYCSTHVSIIADELTERGCNKIINCIWHTSHCELVEKSH